jgi:hypothetical protein
VDLIRPFQRDDIPEIVKLFRWAFQQNGNHAPGELESYFERVFFENPWRDDELPSWVHVNEDGVIDGFIGVQPKRLWFRGRRIRSITATKLMTARTATPLVASRLLRRVLAGPQDLLYSDISNDAGRRIFEALGGSTIMLYSLKWQRPLRPARHAIAWLGARGAPGFVTGMLGPLGSAADSLLRRRGPTQASAVPEGYTVDDLSLDELAHRLPDLMENRPLHPEYDPRWLEWVLRIAQQTRPHAVLRRRLVRDAQQQPAGWFLYFVEPGGGGAGGAADVLQLVARKDGRAAVFDALLADAWQAGATMLSGGLEPSMVQEMSARHCLFRRADHWTLVQTQNPEILATIATGNAFLSRLEGEW